jgi:hypothetical protein
LARFDPVLNRSFDHLSVEKIRQTPEISCDPKEHAGGLWGVTTYFNPAGYATKLDNLRHFARSVRRQGLKLMLIELVFGDGEFTIDNRLGEWAETVIHLRAEAILWQKERLLNLGIERLPADCDKVVWLDGDLLFGNDSWVQETCKMLEFYKIVQPYDTAIWLPSGGEKLYYAGPQSVRKAGLYALHGAAYAAAQGADQKDIVGRPAEAHPGFAWAARRSLLSAHGIYDRFIVGGGDWVTASAMFSDSTAWGDRSATSLFSLHQLNDLSAWTDGFYREVRGGVGYVTGTVYHLWHGKASNRQYHRRYQTLKDCDFDPKTDIRTDRNGCWGWSSDKPELHRQVKEYFWSRREDE